MGTKALECWPVFPLLQKHGTTSKVPKPTRLDQEEQAKLAKSGLDMKMISSEVGTMFLVPFYFHLQLVEFSVGKKNLHSNDYNVE